MPLGTSDYRGYDANGNLNVFTDRRGKHNGFIYDALNRLTIEEYADGATVRRTYDLGSRLERVVDTDVELRALDCRVHVRGVGLWHTDIKLCAEASHIGIFTDIRAVECRSCRRNSNKSSSVAWQSGPAIDFPMEQSSKPRWRTAVAFRNGLRKSRRLGGQAHLSVA